MKPRAPLCEALCEVEAQPCLSREEKGKAPQSIDGVAYAASTRGVQSLLSREAKLEVRGSVRCETSLASLKQGAPIFSAKFAHLSEIKKVSPSADSVAYAASVPKGTNKVPNRKARPKALYNAGYLRRNAKIKAPLCAKCEATRASLTTLSSAKLTFGGGAKSLASSSEANTISEAVLTSPVVEKRNLKDRVL